MPFNKSHVKYVLDQFDAGVSPHQILLNLRYRDFLPSVTIATIERCIRDNNRVLPNEQTENTTQGNQLPEVDQASPIFPPASQSSPGLVMDIRGLGQSRFSFTTATYPAYDQSALANTPDTFPVSGLGIETKTLPASVEHLDNSALPMQWNAEADKCVLDACGAKKSVADIMRSLWRLGYDITSQEIVDSMAQQGLNAKTEKEKGRKKTLSEYESQTEEKTE